MSHRVESADLPEQAANRGDTAYLLYPGASGSVRVNHVRAEATHDGDSASVQITGFGRGVPERVDAGVAMSVLWPAVDTDGFSLIVDGDTHLEDDTLVLSVTGAVLHRPAPAPGESRC